MKRASIFSPRSLTPPRSAADNINAGFLSVGAGKRGGMQSFDGLPMERTPLKLTSVQQ